MAQIRSPKDFPRLDEPSENTGYPNLRQGSIPMAFQVTSPFNRRLALLPHALVLHINPANLSESQLKKTERIQTRGGYVEQHWGDDLTEISCDGSTGAFMNIYTGLATLERHNTIAWDKFRDLYDLYRNNGSVYDPNGNIVLQGNIMLMYDRGSYLGYFKSFDFEETEASPYTFSLNWTFKVQEAVVKIPVSRLATPVLGPAFQSTNRA